MPESLAQLSASKIGSARPHALAAYAPRRNTVVRAFDNGAVEVKALDGASQVRSLPADQRVNTYWRSIKVDLDAKWMAITRGEGLRPMIRDLSTGQFIDIPMDTSGPPAFDHSGGRAAFVSINFDAVRVLDLPSGHVVLTIEPLPDARVCRFVSDQLLLVACQRQLVFVTLGTSLTRTVASPSDLHWIPLATNLYDISLSDNGLRLLTTHSRGGALTWDIDTRKQLAQFQPRDESAYDAISPDGEMFASRPDKPFFSISRRYSRVDVRRSGTGEVVGTLEQARTDVRFLAFGGGHSLVLTSASQPDRYLLWRTSSAKPIAVLCGGECNSIHFSSNGLWVCALSAETAYGWTLGSVAGDHYTVLDWLDDQK